MQVKSLSAYVVSAAVSLAVVGGCTAESGGLSSSTSPTSPADSIVLPTTTGEFAKAQADGRTQLSALREGVVTAVDGCILIDNLGTLWPAGFTAVKDGTSITIRDQSGAAVANVGDEISVGGGGYPDGTFLNGGVCERTGEVFVINFDAFVDLSSMTS